MAKTAHADLKGSLRLGSYLKKLRSGYGYSLRRVEERARAEGGEIDNSQLSRYEKGICYPSFDKLRVLASVFNVSIQAFSDVVDLEEFEQLKPESLEPAPILDEGLDQLKAGNVGHAFACFERVLDLLDEQGDPDADLAGRARICRAGALSRLGKLSLAERELREALRDESLDRELQSRALLALANIHADQGDQFLAELEAERAFHYAETADSVELAARSMHTLARVMSERGSFARAVECYRDAASRYADCGRGHEEIRVRIQLGTVYSRMGKVREGLRIIKQGLQEAHHAGHRRLEAQAWSNLGSAYFKQKNLLRARSCFRESDALANYNNEKHPDILFHNAFYEWQMARSEINPTREKIAFGRLKALRSSIERSMPEVEAFDAYVERGRGHA
jgi:tetratricopeptide (TPR) repeat protein